MDYMIIILFAVMIAALVFLYKEILTFKNDILVKLDELKDVREGDISDKSMQKLRTLNLDCLQQVRKMTMLQNQPITRTNHFTESDSDEESLANYLSDNANAEKQRSRQENEKVDKVEKVDSVYMSNDDRPEFNGGKKQTISTQPIIKDNDEIDIEQHEILINPSNVVIVDTNLHEDIADDNDGVLYDITNDKKSEEEDDSDEEYENENDDDEEDDEDKKEKDEYVKESDTKKVEDLKGIDEYKLETLKQLAKQHNIPLVSKTKIDGKYKTLNKAEIYKIIKDYFIEHTTKV